MMVKTFLYTLLCMLTATLIANAQTMPKLHLDSKEIWTPSELIEPNELATLLNNPEAIKPIIFNIGVVDDIKGAKNMGAADKEANLNRFKNVIGKLPRKTFIVVYCGCCPFERCPNIRPAFEALKQSGFTNARLLNLTTNIKTDWIDKGYPLKP